MSAHETKRPAGTRAVYPAGVTPVFPLGCEGLVAGLTVYDTQKIKNMYVQVQGTDFQGKAVVMGAPFATHLFVTARTSGAERDAGGISVFLVDKAAKGVTTRDYPTVDGNRASEVYFENVALGADALIGTADNGLPLVEKVVDETIAAMCAEACGVLSKLHTGTVEYTKQRKQFGAPISSFQVLQHRMVDMFINVEQAISMTYMANIKVTDEAERAKAIYAELGRELGTGGNGGASESALAHEAGTPALDGLGPVGGDFHTDKEWIDLTTITPRTYLLMRMIQDVAARPPKRFTPGG
jgi:hypothetical protein